MNKSENRWGNDVVLSNANKPKPLIGPELLGIGCKGIEETTSFCRTATFAALALTDTPGIVRNVAVFVSSSEWDWNLNIQIKFEINNGRRNLNIL